MSPLPSKRQMPRPPYFQGWTNLPCFLASLLIVKAASGLDAATSSLISGPIPAAMLLAILKDEDGFGRIPRGCKKINWRSPILKAKEEIRQHTLLASTNYCLTLVKIDYFIQSAPYGFLFTSRKTLETNEWVSKVLQRVNKSPYKALSMV